MNSSNHCAGESISGRSPWIVRLAFCRLERAQLKYFALLLLLSSVPVFGQDELQDKTPLAKVGTEIITRGEFVMRYETNVGPQRQIEARNEINKEVFLFSMIAEKLLAEEGKKRGLEVDSNYQRAMKEVEDPLVRDELYQEEVRQKIVNTQEEIADAVGKSKVQLDVYMVSASSRAGADFLESRIKDGMKLEDFSFADDSTGDFEGPDSMIVHWGDDNQDIEDAAYKLKPGETSQPVEFGDGWYILKLMGETISSSGPDGETNYEKRAGEILTRRKEAVRMVEYLASALKKEKADAKGQIFSDLSNTMFDLYSSDASFKNLHDRSNFILTRAICDSLSVRLADEWNSPFVHFTDSEWSLREAVDRLFGQGFGVKDPTALKIKVNLDQALRNLIYQEELTRIAYEKNLEMSGPVQSKLSMWSDFYLASLVKQKIADSVQVTDSDVSNYISRMLNDSSRQEIVKLSELFIRDAETASKVSDLLAKGEPFEKIAESYHTADEAGNYKREGYFSVSELGGLGTLLKDVSIGGYVGPVAVNDRFVFAQLLRRDRVSLLSNDPDVDLNLSIRQKLAADKLRHLTDMHVAGLAGEFGVDIYSKRLKETKVTSLPMLMFQNLGFGGRMFATPLIVPEASWVQYWDATKHLIP